MGAEGEGRTDPRVEAERLAALFDLARAGGVGAREALDLFGRVLEEVAYGEGKGCVASVFERYLVAWDMAVEVQRAIGPGQRVVMFDGRRPLPLVGIVVPYPDGWERVAGIAPFARRLRVWGIGCPKSGGTRWAHVAAFVPVTRSAFVEARRNGCMIRQGMEAFAQVEAFWTESGFNADEGVN